MSEKSFVKLIGEKLDAMSRSEKILHAAAMKEVERRLSFGPEVNFFNCYFHFEDTYHQVIKEWTEHEPELKAQPQD